MCASDIIHTNKICWDLLATSLSSFVKVHHKVLGYKVSYSWKQTVYFEFKNTAPKLIQELTYYSVAKSHRTN
jgi:hypothetical protein